MIIEGNEEKRISEENRIFLDKRIISRGNKSLLCRLFRSEVLKPSDISFEHHHTAFEITMVISGSGKYSTLRSDFEYKKGDIFCFCNDEVHKITKLNEKSEFMTLHFEPRFVWSDKFGIADYDLLSGFFERREQKRNKLESGAVITDTIRKLMFSSEEEFVKRKPHFETAVRVKLMSVLIELARSGESEPEAESHRTSTISTASARCIERAMNYIDENLQYDLELESLAEIAKMSRNYFSSLFKKLNGISPWEYITIKRIERAVEYLKTTGYTKLEIATMCGFNNTANFYHAFKKITGKAPGDYINAK